MSPIPLDRFSEAYAKCELIFNEAGGPADFRLIEANRLFEKMVPGGVAGSLLRAILPAGSKFFEHCSHVALTGAPNSFELSTPDRLYQVIAFSEHPNEFSAFYIDLTALRSVTQSCNKYRQLFEKSNNIILFINENGNILEANPAAIAAYGYSADEITSMNIRDLRDGSTISEFDTQFDMALEKGIFFETLHKRRDGRVFPVEVSSMASFVDGEKIAMSIIRDITSRKELESELTYLANYDFLTGIPNRSHIMSRFHPMCDQARVKGTKLAVLFFDIDKFKRVNDTFGHESGDLVLKAAVSRVSAVVNGLLGRIGGDEFVILEPFTSLEGEIQPLIQTIFSEFARPIEILGHSISVTTSIGVAVYPDDSQNMDTLLKYADNAMYDAKRRSGNSSSFYCRLWD